MAIRNKSKAKHTPYPHRKHMRWDASVKDAVTQLHSVSEPRYLKSSMKVSSLEDSLRSCEDRQQFFVKIMTSRNLMKAPSANKANKLSRGLSRMGKSLRSIPFPQSSSRREPDDEDRACDNDQRSHDNKSESPVVHNVAFKTLQFRVYKILAGTNPGVSRGGPAIELGWEHEDTEPVAVDEFESARGPRRTLKEIKLSRAERERRLRETGVTEKEIKRSTKQINLAKASRKKTLESISSDGEKNEELKETIIYNFGRLFRLQKTASKKEDELWDSCNRASCLQTSTAA